MTGRLARAVVAALVLLLAAGSAVAAGRQTWLHDPDVIEVPKGRSEADVARAIRYALATRGWRVEQEAPNHVFASYATGMYVSRVNVDTQDGLIRIRYVSSSNLNAEGKNGEYRIHPSYNTWVKELRDEMARRVAQGVADGTPLPAVKGRITLNPPPAEKFSNFTRFDLRPATLAAAYAQDSTAQDALKNIQHALDLKLAPLVAGWNAKAPAKPRVLRIEATVTEIHFVGTAMRVLIKRLAGRSSVILRLRYVDAQTGAVVANPELYLSSEAAARFSFSVADYKMLENIAQAAADYTQANYAAAVGGGTTAPPELQEKS